MNTAKLKQFFRTYGKQIAFLTLAIVVVSLFISVHGAHAEDPVAAQTSQEIANAILSKITFILKGLNKLLLPVIMMIGGLMDGEILFGSGMQDKILEIWIQIRNLVNILFAVALVGIAIFNVSGLVGDGNYQIKTLLPKFVVGLIMVNFSFLALKIGIDAINVGTTAMFALPQEISEEANSIDSTAVTGKFCRALTDTTAGTPEMAKEDDKSSNICNPDGTPTEEFKALLTHWSPKNAAIVMAIQMMNISDLDKVPTEISPTIEKLSINIIFSLVMYMIYASAFVALFIVLLIRLVVLWLGLVLSPFLAVNYVFPNLLGSVGGGDFKDKFIQTALAPMIIGFVLSVGFILMKAFKGINFIDGGNLATTFLGQSTSSAGAVTSGVVTFQEIIVGVGTTAFIWTAVMGALNKTVGSSVTEGLMNAVKGAGEWVAKAPFKYLPLVPVKAPGEDKAHPVPLGVLMRGLKNIPSALDTKEYQESQKIFGGGGGGMDAIRTGTAAKALQALKEMGDGKGSAKEAVLANMNQNLTNWKDVKFPGGSKSTFAQQLASADESGASALLNRLVQDNAGLASGAESGAAAEGTAEAGTPAASGGKLDISPKSADALVKAVNDSSDRNTFRKTMENKDLFTDDQRTTLTSLDGKIKGKNEREVKAVLDSLSPEQQATVAKAIAIQQEQEPIKALGKKLVIDTGKSDLVSGKEKLGKDLALSLKDKMSGTFKDPTKRQKYITATLSSSMPKARIAGKETEMKAILDEAEKQLGSDSVGKTALQEFRKENGL